MARPFPDPVGELHCATIVVGEAVTKIEALALLALVVDAAVEGQRTVRPFVRLAEGAWAEIEIPRFGEPPPLAIDVYSSVSGEHAKLRALSLIAQLEQSTGWRIRPDFAV